MVSTTVIVGYVALFSGVGIAFLFANLLVGKFVRPQLPNQEKLEVYECGEPTIGSSFVQFDLRFYVVALLFIIFDVEVAFFFPWATVYGKATHLMDPSLAKVSADAPDRLTPAGVGLYRELGVEPASMPKFATADAETNNLAIEESARQMAFFSLFDIAAFFAILLVGFAYVWKRGDLDWVRAVSQERSIAGGQDKPSAEPEPALSA